MYVVYIPDEKGRTGLYTLDLGNADSAYIYTPMAGAQSMPVSYTHLDVYKRQQRLPFRA